MFLVSHSTTRNETNKREEEANEQKGEKLRGSFRGVMQDTFPLIFCALKAGPIVA